MKDTYIQRSVFSLAATFLRSLPLLMLAMPVTAQLFTEIDPGLSKPPNPCVLWGDYDSDGQLDLLVAGVGKQDVAFTTLYKNSSGIFTNSGISLLGLSRASASWGDFDNDGDLDLAITGLTSAGLATTRVFRNDSSNFVVVPGNFFGVFAGNVSWVDYDGDGDLDLLITGVTSSTPGAAAATRLYRNDGATFTSVTHPFPDCYLGAVSWGDYDNDGLPDVVITGTTSSGGLVAGLWHNEGGTFIDAGANLPGMDLGFAVWGDFDNDGDLDLLFGGNSNEGWILRVYRNDAGLLTQSEITFPGLIWSSAEWADYDNDGDLDFIVMGYDPATQLRRSVLYRNDGGTFVDSGAAFHNMFLGTLGWGDYDEDGDLDILLAGNDNGQDLVTLYRNNTLLPNTLPTAPTNLTANVFGTTVELLWGPSTDLQTASAGLTYNLRVGTTPGGSQIVSAESLNNGHRLLPNPGNAGHNLAAKIHHLTPGTNYFWSVQAIDTAFAGSPFSVEGTFTALADPPATVSIVNEGAFGIRVTWRGSPGSSYQIFTSSNLSSWAFLASQNAETNGLFSIHESTDIAAARFYRAVRP